MTFREGRLYWPARRPWRLAGIVPISSDRGNHASSARTAESGVQPEYRQHERSVENPIILCLVLQPGTMTISNVPCRWPPHPSPRDVTGLGTIR